MQLVTNQLYGVNPTESQDPLVAALLILCISLAGFFRRCVRRGLIRWSR
jgi:hypothetical protein